MNSVDGLLVRLRKNDTQTLGKLYLYEDIKELYSCVTLELSDKYNQNNISCIPSGNYLVKKRWSDKHKQHLHLQNVKNRSYVLIHSGNYYTQLEGCILVGDKHAFINSDNHLDVSNSRDTLDKILSIIGNKNFNLKIVEI